MNYPTSSYNFKGIEVTMTWILDSDLQKYSPVRQIYAVVFNDKGEILVASESSDGKWQIPGGKPEKGETLEETIKRELLEEVNVKAGASYEARTPQFSLRISDCWDSASECNC